MPLSASQGLDGAFVQPAPDHLPPGPGSKMLPAKEHHGAPERQRDDGSKARLPLAGPPALLCTTDRRRAVELAGEIPGQHRRLKGLVPPDGARADQPVPRLCPPSSCATSPSPMPSQSAHSKTRGEKRPGLNQGRGDAGAGILSTCLLPRRNHLTALREDGHRPLTGVGPFNLHASSGAESNGTLGCGRVVTPKCEDTPRSNVKIS